jgi:hypothetical protein
MGAYESRSNGADGNNGGGAAPYEEFIDYYVLLDVPDTATPEEIKVARVAETGFSLAEIWLLY